MYLNSSIVRGFLLLGSAKSLASLMISWPCADRPVSMSCCGVLGIFMYAFSSSARSASACFLYIMLAAGSLSDRMVSRSVGVGAFVLYCRGV